MKILRPTVLTTALAVTAAGMTACSSGESTGSDGESKIVYALDSQPPTLDTAMTTEQAANEVARNIFESLVTTDSEGAVQPMLAESFTRSDDGKSIIFTLRQDVPFHDGSTMTADDVVASMSRWTKYSEVGAESFAGATWSTVDDSTVKLTMKRNNPTALAVLAFGNGSLPAIMPAEIAKAAGGDSVTDFVGTGPFKFVSSEADQEIVLAQFDDYAALDGDPDGLAGNRTAEADQLVIKIVTDPQTRVLGVLSGKYDVASEIPFGSLDQIKSNPQVEITAYNAGTMSVYFNKKSDLFSDVTARKAVDMGYDKEAPLKAAYMSDKYYELHGGIMTASQQGTWDTSSAQKGFNANDPAKAKKMLAKTGYSGEPLRMIYSTSSSDKQKAALVFQQQMKDIGVQVQLKPLDSAAYSEYREDPNNWELLLIRNSIKPAPLQMAFMGSEFPGWTDSAKLEKLSNEFRSLPSLEAAQEFYPKFEDWYADYMPITKLGERKAIFAQAKDLGEIEAVGGPVLWGVAP